VSTATVYKLCARAELQHVRVLNVIRVPSGHWHAPRPHWEGEVVI
jgi:hypothetical protein